MGLTNNIALGRPTSPSAPVIVDGNFDNYWLGSVPPYTYGDNSFDIDLEQKYPITSIRWKVSTSTPYSDGAWLYRWDDASSAWVQIGYVGAGLYDRTLSFDPPLEVQKLRVRVRYYGYSSSAVGLIYEVAAYAAMPAGLVFADTLDRYLSRYHFGSVVAAETLGPTEVRLYNNSASSVATPSVWVAEQPSGDVIELSKTASPFIAEDPLVFSGTFAPGALIGSVYVRFRPPIISPGGQKSFRLRARATPV